MAKKKTHALTLTEERRRQIDRAIKHKGKRLILGSAESNRWVRNNLLKGLGNG